MKKVVLVALFFILLYTRFVGLDWGLPYPMHPDERNMVNAIQSLNCEIRNSKFEIRNCFNPHFFAYGQFVLYLAYLLIQTYHVIFGKLDSSISFAEAVMALRIIAALVSVINVFVLVRIFQRLTSNLRSQFFNLMVFALFIFSPYFIQFSHFGTTESLLTLFYSIILYETLQLFNRLKWYSIFVLTLISGLAIATKISSVTFVLLPFFSLWMSKNTLKKKSLASLGMITGVVFCTILFSPHNFISLTDFLNSMWYESAVAIGAIKVFYTRQFDGSVPVWFQLSKIFPYVLGWPQYVLAVLGFCCLSWRKKETNLLRFAFLVYLLPNSFLYAKWTRFMAPIFPVISIFTVLFLFRIINHKSRIFNLFTLFTLIFTSVIPGLAYLSIYQNPDVRFIASDWIYKNIPAGSYILSETANVVDIPLQSQMSNVKTQNYQVISFDFYDLDSDVKLQQKLENHLAKADYIFVPSRRIFKNHPAEKYPRVNEYYQKLFSGELGFKKVAEFTSYPRINLFGKTLFEFPDEAAEETWSVFDHPVVRIYKRI